MREGRDILCNQWAIATGPADAARAGAEVFANGGNAMDAAAAACLACAVLEPSAVDIGGYVASGVVLDGKTGRIWSIDSNSVAPAAAREDMFEVLPARTAPRGINELEYACTVRNDTNIYGPLSVGVPGFLAGVGVLWERWGALPWASVVEPSRALVENLQYGLVRKEILFKKEVIAGFQATSQILLPEGRVPEADDHWPRPDLARTLDRIASAGWRDLYVGELGRTIADYVSGHGGILTREDMAAFAPRVTEPLVGHYRNAEIYTAIAPNGGFTVLDALHDLEPEPPLCYKEAQDWLRLSAVLKGAWGRRLETNSPLATPHGTVHVAAADAQGNLVSMTISQGGWFGSCFAVPGTGIILGHGMCRFDPRSGLTNSPGAGKRPLNNICPMILRLPDRDVAIGVRGGRRIVSVAVQLAQRIIDRDASVFEAATAPRLHTIDGQVLEISRDFPTHLATELKVRNFDVQIPDEVAGAAHGAEIHKSRKLRAGGNTWAVGL